MNSILIVWGTGTGQTAMASYDAALQSANIHNYNLIQLSSVIPSGTEINEKGVAPDLGEVGDRLFVVEARKTASGPDEASASLAWATGPKGGILYEAAGEAPEDVIANRARKGVEQGKELRKWSFTAESSRTTSIDIPSGMYGSAVVIAIYGDGITWG
ncbi:MAG: pyruvoyl-dependent arginine decarboxylase [Halobacteriaceae archaeon]